MTREELEHIIRASGEVTGQYEFMIVGSAIVPAGWLDRLHRVQNAATNDRVGCCLDAMPLDDVQQRRLRATIRRWVKALGDAGHVVDDA